MTRPRVRGGPRASRIPREKHVAFLTDAWAHWGSYLAGFIGGVTLWVVI